MSTIKFFLIRITTLVLITIGVMAACQSLYVGEIPTPVYFTLFGVVCPLIGIVFATPFVISTPTRTDRLSIRITQSFYLIIIVWSILGVFLLQNNFADCSDCNFTTHMLYVEGISSRALTVIARQQMFLGGSAMLMFVFAWVALLNARAEEYRLGDSYQFIPS